MSLSINAWFKQALQRRWYCLSSWHLLLIPVSWLFVGLSLIRRLAYTLHIAKSYQLPVPVIVVGNINVGGTGKTPLVLWLAQQLSLAGYKPAIISRGYGASQTRISPVYADSDPRLVGDEPVLLARHTAAPVWVGRDRVAVAQKLLQVYPECNAIISDDGLQHYRLRRDIELVVVDAARGFGNGYRLPAGPLREGIGRLKKVDALIYNGEKPSGAATDHCFSMVLRGTRFRNLQDTHLQVSAASFTGKTLHAVAGIGNPRRFFQQLERMGLQFQRHEFPDHHLFQLGDLQIKGAEVILMTEKDAVKCQTFAQPNWWFLPVETVLDDALMPLITSKLVALKTNT